MFKSHTLHTVLTTAAVLASTTLASAQPATTTVTLTTRDGKGADAFVQGGESAGKNFGTHFLTVKNGPDKNFMRKSYVRFDLTKVASPLTALDTVTLQLTLAAAVGASPADQDWTIRLHGLPDGDAGESWEEKAITWDNAPLNDTESGKELKAGAVPLGTFKVTGAGKAGDTISFTSPELLAWLKTDTNKLATIVLTRDEPQTNMATNVSHAFEPKEQSKAARPTLVLIYKG